MPIHNQLSTYLVVRKEKLINWRLSYISQGYIINTKVRMFRFLFVVD